MAGARLEVRGRSYQMIKDIFPHISEIVGPQLGKYFEGVELDRWYDAGPYLEVIKYLRERVSPQVVQLIGNRFVELFKQRFLTRGITSIQELLCQVAALYADSVRGEGAGGWHLEEFKTSRAIVKENGIFEDANFALGVLKSAIESFGAYNVRVTVLDDRAEGAPFNRYLVEWAEPNARSNGTF